MRRSSDRLPLSFPGQNGEYVLSDNMLYHKATLITRPEADFIIRKPTSSLNSCVVVECFGKWYDVRRMTESELADFLDNCTERASPT
jgi:hypothetical protein